MKKNLLLIVVLLLISYSSNGSKSSRLLVDDFDLVNEQVENLIEVEHTDLVSKKMSFAKMEQTNETIKELISNTIEKSTCQLEIPKDEINPSVNSITQKTESTQTREQAISSPPKQDIAISDSDPVEIDSPPVESASPPVEISLPQLDEPEELSPDSLCPSAWYDENQACNWIHPNLKPIDELGRTVPIFTKPEDAWNWAEKQMFDKTSIWYMCGFNLMDGHTNDGSTFFYGYMKACP